MTKFACPICGHLTIDARYDWDICPICFWEDDTLVDGDKDATSSANGGMLVSEAQTNYILYGYSHPKHKGHVRPPQQDEPKDPNWTPLAKTRETVARAKLAGQ